MNLFNSTGKRARVIGTVLLLVTFVAGALAGAASERVMRAEDDDAQPAPARSDMRGGSRRLLMDDQFAQELQLTVDQRNQIKAIMDRRDQDARKLWGEVEPRFKDIGDATRREIEKVLTPEQLPRLEAEIARRHADWKDRHKCQRGDSLKAPRSQN